MDLHQASRAEPAPGRKTTTLLRDRDLALPVITIHGNRPGPRVLLTAGVHGCEYCSIQAAIELASELDGDVVAGRLTIVPLANTSGFTERLPEIVAEDGKNLNRVFPGRADGSRAERLAHLITGLQDDADFYVDMHGGDLHESMHPLVFIPGVAGEQVTSRAREAAQVLDVDVRVLSSATTGAYNSAALRGVPSLLIERGGNGVWSRAEVDAYKRDIRALLAHLQLLAPLAGLPHREQREIRDAVYLTAKDQGCWYPDVTPGAPVSRGETLGTVCDIFGRAIDCYRAEKDGIVLYMTVSLAVKAGTPLVAYG